MDADPIVWLQIVSTFIGVDRLYGADPGHAAFVAYARERLQPLAVRLGWDARPNEESNVGTLRQAVLEALSRFGDTSVIAEAHGRFDAGQQTPSVESPAVRRTALEIVARTADASQLDRLIALYRATRDPLEKQNILEALAGIADAAGAQRVLELAISPDAPAGTVGSIIRLVSRDHPDLAWNFALQHVDQPGFPLDSSARLRLMPGIASQSSDLKRAADLEMYADRHIPASARRNVESAIATINLNVKFRTERLPQINAWVAKNAAKNAAQFR